MEATARKRPDGVIRHRAFQVLRFVAGAAINGA
jgi:hypothetical protein